MPAPVLTGQTIGRTHFATRALLERQLGDLPFPAWTALNLVGRAAAPGTPADLLAEIQKGLRIEPAAAGSVLDDLMGRDLVRTAGGVVGLTPAGRALFERVTAQIGRIAEALYGDIPQDEQQVARRVLDRVRERAEQALAG